MKKVIYLIFILSLIGLGVSVYLAYEYSLPTKIGCPIGGTSCETVRNSEYSTFLGISLPYLGILFYLFAAVLSILSLEKNAIRKLLFLLSISGFVFSAYLTALEAFVIKAYCFWCVVSALISTLIFILSIPLIKKDAKISRNEDRN